MYIINNYVNSKSMPQAHLIIVRMNLAMTMSRL